MNNAVFRSITNRKTPNDLFYTPVEVVKQMIELCDITPSMKVLDPCKGSGRFYDNLPECNKDWCEITDNKDFFEYTDRVDLVIGNPPFSMWNKWLEQTIKITDKFCYIMGTMNVTDARLRMLEKHGYGVTKIHYVRVDYWYGYHVCLVIEKGAKSLISVAPNRINCEECGGGCGRGYRGKSANICGLLQVEEKD